jgi:hypothetical protein
MDIICVPSFVEVIIDNQERTAVRLSIEKRADGPSETPAPSAPTPESHPLRLDTE